MEEFERRARRGEVSPHALVSIPPLTGDAFVEARSLPIFTAVYDPRRLLFRRHFHLGRLPLVTGAVVVICVLLWLFAKDLGDGAATKEALLALGAKSRARIVDEGESWRLIAASFLHKDGAHLGFNLFVLVAVGTVLEGVYRRGDYALLLLLSGLACMTTSVIASPPATVGASGLVFGCLGCAMVFGLRFADVLPLRYRIYFGVVLVAYTMAAFWSGLLRTATDNWGHAGGLCCGALCGMLWQPRLLRLSERPRGRLEVLGPWLVAVAVAAVVVAIGPLIPRAALRFEPLRFSAFGVVLEHPSTWARGPDPLGFVAVGNGTDTLASLACSRAAQPTTTSTVARRFVDAELFGLSRGGHIANLEVDPAADVVIAGVPGKRVGFSFIASDGPFRADSYVFVRGNIDCVLVAASRAEATPRARALLAELVKRLRIEDTDAERTAITLSERHASSTSVWIERAAAHAIAGDVTSARDAITRARALVVHEPNQQRKLALTAAQVEVMAAVATGRTEDAERAITEATAAGVNDFDIIALRSTLAASR